MLRITQTVLRDWADKIGIDNLVLAEHDYRLSHLLNQIYSDPYLGELLILKGGTAINKLHLGQTNRLSVDLDFNHIGTKQQVLKTAKNVRENLVSLSESQDPSYRVTFDRRYDQTTIHLKYTAIAGVALQPIKLEISHVERFPILPVQGKKLLMHDSGKTVEIRTYRIEELLATKLRALYDRVRGRDLYDLNTAFDLISERTALRKMFFYYFYRDRKVFNAKTYFKKVSESSYIDDVHGFIRPEIKFDLQDAKVKVIKRYSFLKDLDSADNKFLSLSRYLLGHEIKKDLRSEIINMEYPFRLLFEGIQIVNSDIFNLKMEEIKPYEKPRQEGG